MIICVKTEKHFWEKISLDMILVVRRKNDHFRTFGNQPKKFLGANNLGFYINRDLNRQDSTTTKKIKFDIF